MFVFSKLPQHLALSSPHLHDPARTTTTGGSRCIMPRAQGTSPPAFYYIFRQFVYRDYLWNMNGYNNMSSHGTRMTTTTMNSRYYKPTHQHQDEWNSRCNTFNINDCTQRGFKQRDVTSVVFASSMFFLFFTDY